jgi:hypothetical protein
MTRTARTALLQASVFATLALAVAGCVVQPVNSYPPVPEPRAEVIPPPPQPNLVWQPGHYQWDGRAYRWEPGRYINRPYGTHWVRGHWAPEGGRQVWVAPHWQ